MDPEARSAESLVGELGQDRLTALELARLAGDRDEDGWEACVVALERWSAVERSEGAQVRASGQ